MRQQTVQTLSSSEMFCSIHSYTSTLNVSNDLAFLFTSRAECGVRVFNPPVKIGRLYVSAYYSHCKYAMRLKDDTSTLNVSNDLAFLFTQLINVGLSRVNCTTVFETASVISVIIQMAQMFSLLERFR